MSWIALLYVFLLAHVKFLVTATIALATYPELSVDEIFISSSLGAISCFNIFYFISQKFYFGVNKQPKKIKAKKSKTFKKRNRILIKMKQSKIGFLLVCTLAPLFLSIPIGTVVTVKFFGDNKKTYWYVSILLIIMSFILAYLNDSIFQFFE
tara:strand:- start:27 stop:482 length:456 start_codon:yes stop_codon:yes gene_type:complete